MIFDSKKMQELRELYSAKPDFPVSDIVFLDREPSLSKERQVLEEVFEFVPDAEKNILLGKLVNEDRGNHVGAWFQLMLLAWLREADLGTIQVEPHVFGNHPDFLVSTNDGENIVIEARAILDRSWQDPERKHAAHIFQTLHSIERPFFVSLSIESCGDDLDTDDLRNKVTDFLDFGTSDDFVYDDKRGNKIRVEAAFEANAPRLKVLLSLPTIAVSPEPLKRPLAEKSRQHRQVRANKIPYVLAFYLESTSISAEEVQEAWGGRTTAIVEMDTGKLLQHTTDRTGLLYEKGEIRFKNVSGTLVFKSNWVKHHQRRYLVARYVQNPHALVPVDPYMFPAESYFVEIGRSAESIEMAWINSKQTQEPI